MVLVDHDHSAAHLERPEFLIESRESEEAFSEEVQDLRKSEFGEG
jgi:hypothetical protein